MHISFPAIFALSLLFSGASACTSAGAASSAGTANGDTAQSGAPEAKPGPDPARLNSVIPSAISPGAGLSTAAAPSTPLPAAAASDSALPAAPISDASEAITPGTTRQSPFKIQGIYLQQNTAQSAQRLEHLISNSLEVGINTFIVDLEKRSNYYKKGVQHIQDQGIEYVPRITMFPDGGTHEQVIDRAYWEDRYKLASYAIDLGAKSVQIDYIRYSSKNAASPDNALNIREVLRFLKKRINQRGARLQIDVFGEVSYGPSLHIGQDMGLFAKEIDTVCPMVYPSHYTPYEEHAQRPYETIYGSLVALKRQIGAHNVSVLAYIELFNYRHRLEADERVSYIRAELRAVREANADGWLAWSAGNKYDILFDLMRRYGNDAAGESL